MRIDNSKFNGSLIQEFLESTEIASYVNTAEVQPLTREGMVIKQWVE